MISFKPIHQLGHPENWVLQQNILYVQDQSILKECNLLLKTKSLGSDPFWLAHGHGSASELSWGLVKQGFKTEAHLAHVMDAVSHLFQLDTPLCK